MGDGLSLNMKGTEMMTKVSRASVWAICAAMLLGVLSAGSATPKTAEAMLQQAATENKHLVVLAWTDGDDATTKLKAVLDQARVSLAGKAFFFVLKTDDASNKDFVAKYKLATAPLPLTLVFAPNGVVVGASVQKVVDQQTLAASFASPKLADVLKLLQDGKLVLLCVQTKTTKSNAESLGAAQGAAADERAKGQIQVVQVDPTDQACADVVAPLKLPANLEEATIRILVPPGTVAGEVKGATTQAAVWDAITKAVAACSGGGWGTGGCG